MTNEELVTIIQAGRDDLLFDLWAQVERFVKKEANRYAQYEGGFAEYDDLYNSGYVAFIGAVNTYSPTAGMSFIGWLAFYMKKEFNGARYGGCSAKQKRDPLNYAVSLDAPIDGDDPSADTLNEIIADPEDPMEAATDKLFIEALHRDLDSAINQLIKEEQTATRLKYFRGSTVENIAEKLQVSDAEAKRICEKALAHLRSPKLSRKLLKYLDDRTDFYRNNGFSFFDNIRSSTVELLAIKREEMKERIISVPIARNVGTKRDKSTAKKQSF